MYQSKGVSGMTLLEAPPATATSPTSERVESLLRCLEQKRRYHKEDHLAELSRSTLDAHRRVDRVEVRIDRFEENVNARFDVLQTEFGIMQDTMRRIEARLEDVIGRFTDPKRPPQ
jgi:hypothetical protein